MPKPYIVGICGGSASGKTFLLNQLLSRLPEDQVSVISQDNYYKKREEQNIDAEGLINFDHPDSLNLGQLSKDIASLIRGEAFTVAEYDFVVENPTEKLLTFHPTPLVIVEGLFVFYEEELTRLMDLKLFIEADEHVRIARRLKRDIQERGYSMEEVLASYQKFVAPMYERFVRPTRKRCDLLIPNNKHMYKAIQVVVSHLLQVLEER